jgi:hypothetical protein
MRTARIGLSAALLGLLAGSAGAQATGWWGALYSAREVTLGELLGQPGAWRQRSVEFTLTFESVTEPGQAYHTRFDGSRHLTLAVWDGDAALWEEAIYDRPFKHLFVPRDSEPARRMAEALRYSRWRVRARVEEVLRGEPWLEVSSAELLPEILTEGALIRIVKGRMLCGLRRTAAAAAEFRAADAPTLPTSVRVYVMREEARCLERDQRLPEALARAREAVVLAPADAQSQALLARLQALAGPGPVPVSDDGGGAGP